MRKVGQYVSAMALAGAIGLSAAAAAAQELKTINYMVPSRVVLEFGVNMASGGVKVSVQAARSTS